MPSLVELTRSEPHAPRVALIGPLDSQFTEIKAQVDSFSRPVELRCLDKEHQSAIPVSCDFAIVTGHCRHRWWDAARNALGNSRVYFVDGGTTQIVQKLRDIAAMQ